MSTQRFHRPVLSALGVLSALILQACGCTLVGCIDGLLVDFPARPAGPYRVELFVNAILQPAPEAATCTDARGCFSGIVFRTTATNNLVVRVTTAAGARETVFPHVTYTKSSPNGPSCGPTCSSARVTVQAPE